MDSEKRLLWNARRGCTYGNSTCSFGSPKGSLQTSMTIRRPMARYKQTERDLQLMPHFYRVLDRYGLEVETDERPQADRRVLRLVEKDD